MKRSRRGRTGPPIEAHAGQRANPVATGASLLEFEVVLDVAGSKPRLSRRRAAPRRALALSAAAALVVTPRSGLLPVTLRRRRTRRTPDHRSTPRTPPGSAGPADHGHAELGLADRPGRSSHPGRCPTRWTRSKPPWKSLWWDRPFTLDGCGHRRQRGHAAPHLLLRRAPRHPDSHRRHRRGRSVRPRDPTTADDQLMAGRRRRC